MRHRHTLSLATWVSAATLILAACSDDSATTARNASSTSATRSTTEPDSTVKQISAPPATSAIAETTSEDLQGAALYLQTCHDALEYFDAFRELADLAGEPFDAKEAADGLLELARTGGEEFRQDLEASGELDDAAADPDEPTWDEIPKTDRSEIERAIYAAANDDC